MFQAETENIVEKVEEIVFREGNRISLRDILSAPIHNFIKVFFKGIAWNEIKPEEHEEDSFSELKNRIEYILPSNHIFNRDMFLSTLNEAVRFYFKFLLKPKATMTGFIFIEDKPVTLREVKLKFLYFPAYDYYYPVLLRYMQKHNMEFISSIQFQGVVSNTDKIMFEDAEAEDHMIILAPLFEFVRYGRVDNDDSVPLHAIEIFYEDKGFDPMIEYLHRTFKEINQEVVGVRAMRKILENVAGGRGKERKKIEDEVKIRREEAPAMEEPVDSGTRVALSLNDIITDNAKDMFIRKLFNGDEAYYKVVIKTIDNMTSWKEATLYIDEQFLINNIDPYKRECILFTDMVYNKFSRG